MGRIKIKFLIIIGILLVFILVGRFIFRRELRRVVIEWYNEPAEGIIYAKTDDFFFPDNLKVLIGSRNKIILRSPKTSMERILLESKIHNHISCPEMRDNGDILFIGENACVNEHQTQTDNDMISVENEKYINLCTYSDGKESNLYSARDIKCFSLSPDGHVIAGAEADHRVELRTAGCVACLFIVNMDLPQKQIKSTNREFDLYSKPAWLTTNEIIMANKEGLVKYSIASDSFERLIQGPYHSPVIWNGNHLIFKEHSSKNVWISNLDGSEKKLLFRNKYTEHLRMLTLTSDNKYLCCSSTWINEKARLNFDLGIPGLSIFVMNLDNKIYTYYPVLAEKEKWTEIYPHMFSWCNE